MAEHLRLGGTADLADFHGPIARPVSGDFRHFFTQIAAECGADYYFLLERGEGSIEMGTRGDSRHYGKRDISGLPLFSILKKIHTVCLPTSFLLFQSNFRGYN